MLRSFTKVFPLPRVPPRSPRKKEGPMPTPISNFPSAKLTACEKDCAVKMVNKITSTIGRTEGTLIFMVSDFPVSLLLDFSNKIEQGKSAYNDAAQIFVINLD